MNIKIPKIKIPKIKVYGIDVIKNAGFFALFIIISLISLALFIAPAIKIFKTKQREYYDKKIAYENKLQELKTKQKELKILKNKNRKIILAVTRDFNINHFKKFANEYLNVISIKEVNKTLYKKRFIKTTYTLKSTIKTPKNFYDFVDNVKNYKNLIRVYFPVEFIKNRKDINLTLKIEVYKFKK